MKKFRVILLVVLGILILIGLKLVGSGANRDLRVVSFGDWGIELINFSLQRRLVSVAMVPSDFQLWVPGGYGWYEAGKIAKLAEMAGEGEGLVAKILFFNFGLIADRVVRREDPDWWRPRMAMFEVTNLGWWWNWEIASRLMLEKNEQMTRADPERMEREYADVNWLSDSSLRWVVVNRAGISGLAAMIGERLEWAGVWVSGVTNDTETNTNCVVKRPAKLTEIDEEIISSIAKIMSCSIEVVNYDITTEVVVELGKRWGEMVKYNNYVRAF